jgi:hypothetical protein
MMSVPLNVLKFSLCCEDTKVVGHRFDRMCTILKEIYKRLTGIVHSCIFMKILNICCVVHICFPFYEN